MLKVFLHYVKDNSSRLFLTPFYSPPMRFAGTSAGTFYVSKLKMQDAIQAARKNVPVANNGSNLIHTVIHAKKFATANTSNLLAFVQSH
jgi:hypothetical protein